MSTNEQTVGATIEDGHQFHIDGNIGHQHVNNDVNHGLEILKEFVSFNALRDSFVQDPGRVCHPGTRERELNKIRDWADDPSAPERILWLHGPAGSGKSAIAQTISSDLYRRDKIGASFFFFRSDPTRNDGNRLFPTLAWQLALSVPIVQDLVASSLKEDPYLPLKSIEAQFDQLIAQPFLTISGGESESLTRVIVIDGLDEFYDVKLQRRILKVIGHAIANPRFPLRFLISSRTEAHINDFFTQLQYPNIQIDLANADDASRDVETYLTSEFARIAVERDFDPSWPGQEKIQRLVSMSAGNFVYAATAVSSVGHPDNDPKTQLDMILELHTTSPFAQIDRMYLEILRAVQDQDFLNTFLHLLVAHCSVLEDSLSDCDSMLMDISGVELAVKLHPLRSILRFEPHIGVFHNSFLDFLEDSSRSGQYHVSKNAGMRRYLELIMKLLIGHATRLTKQPDFHESDHFAPEFGKLINHNPQAIELTIEDWEQNLLPFLNALDRLLVPSHIDSLIDGYCQQCRFFQIAYNTLAHFQSLQERQDPAVEKCLKSLELIRYGQQNFHMSYGRIVFGSAAIFGFLMAILAHLDSNTDPSKIVAYEVLTCISIYFIL